MRRRFIVLCALACSLGATGTPPARAQSIPGGSFRDSLEAVDPTEHAEAGRGRRGEAAGASESANGGAIEAQSASDTVFSASLQSVLDAAGPQELVPVIITFRQTRAVRDFRDGDRVVRHERMVRALRAESDRTEREWGSRLALEGARRARRIWVRNAIAVELPADAVVRLSQDRDVARVDYDAKLAAPITQFAMTGAPEWNLETVGAPALWALGETGSGALVATLDTGVDANHTDLAAKWRGGPGGWFDPHGEHATPYDVDGHGTQAMGIIVGGDATGTSVGMAPDATWMAAKVFDDSGNAQISDIELAFQWLLDPDSDPSTYDLPDVVNNSWVFSNTVNVCDPILQTHIDNLRAAGVAVVFSAGNSGASSSTSNAPANTPGVVAVGAVDGDPGLPVSSFSARGPSACDAATPFPTVVAPGRDIKTTDLTFGFLTESFNYVTGTSFAAPHVAGAVALLRGAFPGRPLNEIEAAIEATAYDAGQPGADIDYGYGVLDVAAAYDFLVGSGDADGDGYSVGADCDDADPNIYPGAEEIARDGIDQDCNGYDLTLQIVRAVYRRDRDSVWFVGSSDVADPADPDAIHVQLIFADGSVSDVWSARRDDDESVWTLEIEEVSRRSDAEPASIIVSGLEGEITGALTVYPRPLDERIRGATAVYHVAYDQVRVRAYGVLDELDEPADLRMYVTFADGSTSPSAPVRRNARWGRWRGVLGRVSNLSASQPISATIYDAFGSEITATVVVREDPADCRRPMRRRRVWSRREEDDRCERSYGWSR